MPSDALLAWQNERMPRLQNIEADCLHLEALHLADPGRVQEYIRCYAVLLSAEFQAFCRDLHDQCAEKIVEPVNRIDLQNVLLSECVYGRKLDTGNPTEGNLGADFNRYGLEFWKAVLAIDPGHATRKSRLGTLSDWRNAIAHHYYDPVKLGGTTLSIVQVTDWRTDCDALANAFDIVAGNHLLAITGILPWPP
jgi:RiboL-PSP-HEPN